MTRHKIVLMLILLAAVTVSAPGQRSGAPGKTEETQPAVKFENNTSQTSVWPGDKINYWITLTVPAGIKVSLEDFDRRSVNFKPFLLVDSNRTTAELEGGVTRYNFDYVLANYEIGDRVVEIPHLIFRYQKTLAPGSKEPSTAEMQIPPFPIALRSTLNQPARQAWIQESLPGSEWLIDNAWMRTIGLGLAGVLLSMIPLILWAVKHVPHWKSRERTVSQKKFIQQCSQALDSLGKGLEGNPEEIRKQYQKLEGIAQQYVRYYWNVEAAGLTGSELARLLEKQNVPPRQRELLSGVLDHGQNCRFSPSDGGQWGNALQQDLRDVRNVVRSR